MLVTRGSHQMVLKLMFVSNLFWFLITKISIWKGKEAQNGKGEDYFKSKRTIADAN